MDKKRKGEYIGAIGALLLHMVVIALLVLATFAVPHSQEEGGIPVMLGDTDAAMGNYDPSTMVDVDVLPQEELSDAQPQEPSEEDMITQTEEETVAIKPKTEPKKAPQTEVKRRPEKTAAEKAVEIKRLAEAKAEQERLAAAEIAAKRVSGAFGKGSQMGESRGTADSGNGVEGSKTGNSSAGANTGSGGYGTFNLGGRSIGEGGLPRPVYNVQEEGRVVVAITVNPAGQVISTRVTPASNTVNTALRKAAEDAAKKARFNSVNGVNNQTGTITYNFNLR